MRGEPKVGIHNYTHDLVSIIRWGSPPPKREERGAVGLSASGDATVLTGKVREAWINSR